MELAVDQMNLTEVRDRRIARHTGAMLHGRAGMGITLDTETHDQPDADLARLRHRVGRAAAHRDDHAFHHARPSALPNRSTIASANATRPVTMLPPRTR